MSRRDLVVSAVVAGLCAAILVLFTAIEDTPMRWLHCCPLARPEAKADRHCR